MQSQDFCDGDASDFALPGSRPAQSCTPPASFSVVLPVSYLSSDVPPCRGNAVIATGMSELINGEPDGGSAWMDITEVPEIWFWSQNHLISLLWPGECVHGCEIEHAANYGAVQETELSIPSYPDDVTGERLI